MRREPLSMIKVLEILKELSPKMETLKETQSVALTSEELQLMDKVHDSIRVFSNGQMALSLNTTCGSCVREALAVYSSFYDRHKESLEPQAAEDVQENPYADQLDPAQSGFEPNYHEKTGFDIGTQEEAPLPEVKQEEVPAEFQDQLAENKAVTFEEPEEVIFNEPTAPVEPDLTGVPLNTEESLTTAQKTARTKALNKAKAEQEGK